MCIRDREIREGREPPVYYLDYCSVDQHAVDQAAGNSAMPFEVLQKEFVEKIRCCEKVVIVGVPFDGPLVAKRM